MTTFLAAFAFGAVFACGVLFGRDWQRKDTAPVFNLTTQPFPPGSTVIVSCDRILTKDQWVRLRGWLSSREELAGVKFELFDRTLSASTGEGE